MKTTIALLAIAERQKIEDFREQEDPNYVKKFCVFVDAEHALDLTLAEEYGVNLNEMVVINPDTAERAMDSLDLLIRSGDVGLAIVDSVPALIPTQMEESSYEQQFMALNARFMSGVCQRMTGPLYRTNTTLVFINQIREQPGKYSPIGVATTTPGGRSLKYYSTIRLEIKRGESIKQGSELVGHQMKLRTIKNKIASPFREAAVNLIYGQGIDKADELFQVALKSGLIEQAGAWFTYLNKETGEIRVIDGVEIRSQGRAKMLEMIRTIPELYGELEDFLRGVEVEADEVEGDEKEAAQMQAKEG